MVPRLSRLRRSCLALTLGAAALSIPASAQAGSSSTGGAAFGEKPTVRLAQCATGEQWECRTGEQLTLRGNDLEGVTTVEFLGRRGTQDDRRARPRRMSARALIVVVPTGANTGPIRARTSAVSARVARSLRIVKAAPAVVSPTTPADAGATPEAGVFPIRGTHDMGQTATNSFGGARRHGGQDMFAKCGTPLVAVDSAVVQAASYQDRAGNYLVLKAADGQSYAYMHMRSPALVKKGDTVTMGQQVGEVGQSGRASGCHLHFEQWTAPGWYTGGKAIDPMPLLRQLEAAPHPHR